MSKNIFNNNNTSTDSYTTALTAYATLNTSNLAIIQTDLATESINRSNGDTTLTTSIATTNTTIATNLTNVNTTIVSATNTEIAARNTAITTAINTEITARNTAISNNIALVPLLTATNVFSGINNFSNTSPQTSAATNANINSIGNTSLITKLYADSTYGTSILGLTNIFTGTSNTFNNTLNCGSSIVLTSSSTSNTKYGYQCFNSIPTGNGNCAFGYQSSLSMSSGINNTSFGHQTLRNNNGGSYNTAVGSDALYNCTSSNNAAFGQYSLYNCNGSNNTALGTYSMIKVSTGSNNVGIGNGVGTTYPVSGSANTLIGCLTNSTTDSSYSTCLGYSSVITGDRQIILGTANETVYIVGGFNMSISTVSTTSTLSLPLQSNYFVLNGSTAITITLPSPASGSCINIRRGLNSTALVSIYHTSGIIAYNLTTSAYNVANGISSSYIFYSGFWYQKDYF